jgi:hypothetical protein
MVPNHADLYHANQRVEIVYVVAFHIVGAFYVPIFSPVMVVTDVPCQRRKTQPRTPRAVPTKASRSVTSRSGKRKRNQEQVLRCRYEYVRHPELNVIRLFPETANAEQEQGESKSGGQNGTTTANFSQLLSPHATRIQFVNACARQALAQFPPAQFLQLRG